MMAGITVSGVCFREQLQGHLKDAWGRVCGIDLDLRAEASSVLRFGREGRANLSGIAHLPPFAEQVTVEGQIAVSMLRRRIGYSLHFEADGCAYRLQGVKRIRWRQARETLTRLDAELVRDGEIVARGELFFDLNRLFFFAASFSPKTARSQPSLRRSLHHREPAVQALSHKDRRRLMAIAEVLIVPGGHVPEADRQTIDRLDAQFSQVAANVARAYGHGLRAFELMARLRYGKSLAALSPPARLELLSSLYQNRLPEPIGAALRSYAFGLCAWIKSAHFGRPDYLQSVGYPLQEEVKSTEPPGRHMRQVTTADSLDGRTRIEADVVVVGSGAGGAALSASLAAQGHAVVIVEEGPYRQRQEFSGGVMERSQRLWRQGATSFSVGRPPIAIPLGTMVGGTTAINSGTCLRPKASVLRSWREQAGFPQEFSLGGLDAYLKIVERELHVAPAEKRYLGAIADIVAQGAETLGFDHFALPRNAPDCDAQGTCIFGCSTGAKRSTDVSFIPRALKAGASLFTGLPVTQILRRGRRVQGVIAEGVDSCGQTKRLEIAARAVVLSCGTVGSPVLLESNGWRNPWLGRNLSLHPALGMWGLCEQSLEPWRAIPQGYGVDVRHEGLAFEGFYLPPEMAALSMPLWGEELTRYCDQHHRLAQFGFMVQDDSPGSVHATPWGTPLIRYELSKVTQRLLQQGAAILAELLLKGGAEEVLTGISGQPVVRSAAQARELAEASISALDFHPLGAHPLGTCKMGASAGDGVLDFDHRVYGSDNLYVVDGSAIPTALGVNPQITIMTLALRAADIIGATLA